MPSTITLNLTEDEAELIIDALESDAESYVESADAARKEGDSTALATFREAAQRIKALRDKVQAVMGD